MSTEHPPAGRADTAAPRRARDVEAEAADWLAAQDGAAWTPTQQQALEAWLAQATAHRVAFLRLQNAWQRADRLRALHAPAPPAGVPSAPAPLPAPPSPRPAAPWWRAPWSARRPAPWPAPAGPRWRGAFAAGGVAMALAVVMLALPEAQRPWRPGAPHATALGERADLALADGTRLTLNTTTRVRTDVGTTRRRVWLDSGEAYFNVAHDAQRPFVVEAGGQRVTVLGTRFTLRRDGARLLVRVVEGRVQITSASGASAVLAAADAAEATPEALRLHHESAQQMEARLGWLQGQLRLDGLTLAEAAAEFNRYNRRQLRILDPRAAGIRIGGSFDVRNVDGFARLLHSGFGLEVRLREDSIEVGRAD